MSPYEDHSALAVEDFGPTVATFNETTSAAAAAAAAAVAGLEGRGLRWSALGLSAIIVATAAGNVLVCAAVCLERRLQNVTNYFLMSLAIADLLVSLLVMPLAMVVELFGQFYQLALSVCSPIFCWRQN